MTSYRIAQKARELLARGLRVSGALQVSAGLLARLGRGRGGLYPDHLGLYREETAIGPVQREEALLLFALVRVLRPRLVVELGFQRGLSAFNFLVALPSDARIVSFDISPDAAALAKARYGGDPRFRFVHASQEDAAQELAGEGPLDLLFFDASHDCDLNRRTFEALLPLLSSGAVVAVHDTGSWPAERMSERHHAFAANHPAGDGAWLTKEEYLPWVSERRFVNWIGERYPEFSILHLHSARTLRHGLTLLQRSGPLAVP